MGCCKEHVRNQLPSAGDLPETVMACMARMAYQLSCAAEQFYTGRERVGWTQLSDDTCMTYVGQVKNMLSGMPPGDDQHTQLFCRMLRSLTMTV